VIPGILSIASILKWPQLCHARIRPIGHGELERQHVIGIKTRSNPSQVSQVLNQHSADCQQRERQCDLCHNDCDSLRLLAPADERTPSFRTSFG
jgi:hypothetical protein